MNELISVVVPIFRVEKYLKRCVDSLLKQTYFNIEIILVDDGSDDNSPQICDEYANVENRIKVIHQKNGGLSAARNAGIKIAKGKYIAFVDSDDCVSPYYIEYLWQALSQTDSQIAQCDYVDFCEEIPDAPVCLGEIEGVSGREMMKRLSAGKNTIGTVVAWTKLYDIRLFKDVLYAEGKLHEDEFTTYKLFERAEKVAVISSPLYYYFKNVESITGQKISARRLDGLEAMIERYCYYQEKGYTELLALTARHIFENLLVYAKLTKNDVREYETFQERIQNLYKEGKKSINARYLSRQNRLIFQSAATYTSFKRLYKLSMKMRAAVRKLGLTKLYRKIKAAQTQAKYNKELKALLKGYNPEKTLFIVGSIEYDNLGDHAIIYAQKQFLQNSFPDFNVIEIRAGLYDKTEKLLKRKISPKSLLTIPGGGNMGDVWFDDERRRRSVIQSFPNNRILVFPQTIFYSDTKEGKEQLNNSIKIYNAHNQLCLCAREFNSYRQMQELYPKCRVILTPDIVLSLQTENSFAKREGIGLCFRTDKERNVSQNCTDTLNTFLQAKGINADSFSTMSKEWVPIQKRERTLRQLWDKIGGYRLVVTDRLHCMIFCYLLKTPCVVLDNSNHKIQAVYNEWLKDCSYIKFTTEDEVLEEVERMYNSEVFADKGEMQSEFDEIKRYIING